MNGTVVKSIPTRNQTVYIIILRDGNTIRIEKGVCFFFNKRVCLTFIFIFYAICVKCLFSAKTKKKLGFVLRAVNGSKDHYNDFVCKK